MRRPFALFFLTFLLAASQDDLPTPLSSPTPDTLTEPDEDPISDLLKNSSQAPFTELPSGVEIYGKTIRLDGSLNQGNQKASDTIVRYIGDIQLNTDTGLKAYADLAVTKFSKKTVQLSGNVSLYQDGLVYRGESSVFNLETKSFETKDLRLGFSPIMLKAKSIRQITSDGRKVFVAEDAAVLVWVQEPKLKVTLFEMLEVKSVKPGNSKTIFFAVTTLEILCAPVEIIPSSVTVKSILLELVDADVWNTLL